MHVNANGVCAALQALRNSATERQQQRSTLVAKLNVAQSRRDEALLPCNVCGMQLGHRRCAKGLAGAGVLCGFANLRYKVAQRLQAHGALLVQLDAEESAGVAS